MARYVRLSLIFDEDVTPPRCTAHRVLFACNKETEKQVSQIERKIVDTFDLGQSLGQDGIELSVKGFLAPKDCSVEVFRDDDVVR